MSDPIGTPSVPHVSEVGRVLAGLDVDHVVAREGEEHNDGVDATHLGFETPKRGRPAYQEMGCD